MISSTVSCVDQDIKFGKATDAPGVGEQASCGPVIQASARPGRKPFLRVPPFPGARYNQGSNATFSAANVESLTDRVRHLRIGGTFWGAQPPVDPDSIVVRSAAALGAAEQLAGRRRLVLWDRESTVAHKAPGICIISGENDPWHVLSRASALVTGVDDELRLIAALLEVPVYEFDGLSGEARSAELDANALLDFEFQRAGFENPFTGEAMSASEAVELCGFWRSLIDSNRNIAGGLGFAFWKQDHVAPLLWDGSEDFRFLRSAVGLGSQPTIALWRSKVAADAIGELELAGARLVEVEDGFLRSRGLGADCIPPLSITVDRIGAYFDPSRASELELLLETADFDGKTLDRARQLRRMIVAAGIGKYEQGNIVLDRPAGERRHILVPGQVEDDRAVQAGGCGLSSNLELLKRVRDQAPDAYILYKPHPDVLAGHRRGAVPDKLCLEHADEVVGDLPISSLIEMVDEVHVNTSLTGFESLLRSKPVTTYGVPFYAGWGLTCDLGPVPARRTRRRTLDELVAASLLLYPRYLDPVTGLPCPAEVVVARLSVSGKHHPDLVVTVRRIQGKLMRRLRSLVQ